MPAKERYVQNRGEMMAYVNSGLWKGEGRVRETGGGVREL